MLLHQRYVSTAESTNKQEKEIMQSIKKMVHKLEMTKSKQVCIQQKKNLDVTGTYK